MLLVDVWTDEKPVKLASAVDASFEGAAHSCARHALEMGVSRKEVRHIALPVVTTPGFPGAVTAYTSIGDVLEKRKTIMHTWEWNEKILSLNLVLFLTDCGQASVSTVIDQSNVQLLASTSKPLRVSIAAFLSPQATTDILAPSLEAWMTG